jgi:hypothetical protein
VPVLVRLLAVPWVQWQAAGKVLQIIKFKLDFLRPFGSEFELFLVSEDLRTAEQLLYCLQALKSPLDGAFMSFCGCHSVYSKLIAVFGL